MHTRCVYSARSRLAPPPRAERNIPALSEEFPDHPSQAGLQSPRVCICICIHNMCIICICITICVCKCICQGGWGGSDSNRNHIEPIESPKRSRNKKPGQARVWGPDDRGNVESEMPSHGQVESIEPRPCEPLSRKSCIDHRPPKGDPKRGARK